MNKPARIVASAMRDPVAMIRDLGGDPGDICRRAGIDLAAAETEGGIPLHAYVTLFQTAAVRFSAPAFGRLVGSRFDIANIGEVGTAALRAPSIGAALRLIEAAFVAVQDESEFRLEVSGDEAAIHYRILDPEIWPRDQDAELSLGVFASLLARAAGPSWRPSSIAFEHRPNGADEIPAVAHHCEVRYGAPSNEIRFPARLLDLPMPTADASIFRPAAAELRREAQRLERAGPVARRVRRAVLADLGRHPVDQTRIAGALGLTRRTLRRRLSDEGAGFAEIVASCRDGLARRLLGETDLPLAEVAARLGYSETSAFERAFRKRVGRTPAAYREQLQKTVR